MTTNRAAITVANRGLAGATLLLCLTACASGPDVGVIPEHPDFTGTWVLDPEASEQPGDELFGPRGREPGVSRTRTPLSTSFLPSVAFKIAEADSALIFTDAQGRRRTIYQDGRTFRQPTEGLGNLAVQGWWDDDEFVIERQLESGPKIIETYKLRNGGRQLRVRIEIIAGRRIDLVRVYDRTDRT